MKHVEADCVTQVKTEEGFLPMAGGQSKTSSDDREKSSLLCILICWLIVPAANGTTLLAGAVTSEQPRLSVQIRSSKPPMGVAQGWPRFLSSASRRNASLPTGFLLRQHTLDKLFLQPAHSWTGPLLLMYWPSVIFCSKTRTEWKKCKEQRRESKRSTFPQRRARKFVL